MRICILTQADSLAWTQHYVDAFRQRAEVLTVGPGLRSEERAGWGVGDAANRLVPNDIEVTLTPDLDLRTVLPPGWVPDLLVGISKGGVALRTLPDMLDCPFVYLSIDTWQSPIDYVDAQSYDFVFAAQRSFVDRLRAAGAANVRWLPLAANPAVHFPTGVAPDVDISFVGRIVLPVHQSRYDLINRLQESFTSVVMTELWGDDVCRAIARGRIAFNHSAVLDVNMRIFESMAMGRPVLTNRDAAHNGLLDLFEDGQHLIVYDGVDDVVEKARFYLDDEGARETIARTGYESVLAHHTYLHRVDAILETVRAQIPAMRENHAQTTQRIDDPLANLVPFGARHVADFGLSVQQHADRLRARGVEALIGIADKRADNGAYTQVLRLDDAERWPRKLDAVILPKTSLVHENAKVAIRRARNMLEPGGSLIVRLGEQDFASDLGVAAVDQLPNVLCECGFHLNVGKVETSPEGMQVILRARKRTRPLKSLFEEGAAIVPDMDWTHLREWVDSLGSHY